MQRIAAVVAATLLSGVDITKARSSCPSDVGPKCEYEHDDETSYMQMDFGTNDEVEMPAKKVEEIVIDTKETGKRAADFIKEGAKAEDVGMKEPDKADDAANVMPRAMDAMKEKDEEEAVDPAQIDDELAEPKAVVPAMALSYQHTAVLKAKGTVLQARVALGFYHTAVLRSDGTVWTAGHDGYAELGDGGGNTYRVTFSQVIDDAQAVALGDHHTAVLRSDGTVWTAGHDVNGGLGDGGGNTDRSTFRQVIDDAQAVALGAFHTAVVRSDGTLWTAGNNWYGQLGDGGNTIRGTFRQVIDDVRPAPTPVPIAASTPTSAPSTAPTPAAPHAPTDLATAKGDPHLENINGQRFDILREGRHVLLQIPRGADTAHSLLRVLAEARRLGTSCGDMYFQELNVTGAWVEAKDGILQFRAHDIGSKEEAKWMAFGVVELKVTHGHNQMGLNYLNVYVKHLKRTSFMVGGLLGEDDHTYEATPDKDCTPTLNLMSTAPLEDSAPVPLAASTAVASLA